MIPIRVEVTFEPTLTKAEQRILKIPNKIANLRQFMIEDVAPAADRMLLRHWQSKGSAFGHKWAPWAASTLARRLKQGNADKGLLRDTDHLFETVFRQRTRDNRLRKIPNGLRLSLNVGVPYAIFHQVGTSLMPERQVIPDPLPGVFVTEVRKLFRAYLAS